MLLQVLPVANHAVQPFARSRFGPRDFDDRIRVEHTIQPTHQIAFPGVQNIFSFALSPDGGTVYRVVDGSGIDIWAAGVAKWPEVLGSLLGAVFLVYLMIFARVRRRPQVPGAPHCRKCNYSLFSHAPGSVALGAARIAPSPGTRCPECGVDITKRCPRRGRSAVRRLWMPTAALLLCAGGYAALFVAGVPRLVKAANAPEIWSAWLNAFAEKHQIAWLLKNQTAVTRLMTVDTERGAITGCLRTVRGYCDFGMKVSPDGRFLAIAEGPNRLSWVSTQTGSVRASTSGGRFDTTGNEEGFVIAVEGTRDEPLVYFRAADPGTMKSRLLVWNPRTGAQRVLVEESAFRETYPNGARGMSCRRYAVIHRPDGIATLSAPDFTQAYSESKYVVTVRSPTSGPSGQGEVERQIEAPGGRQACSSPLIASPDGSMLFVQNYKGILGHNANTGETLGTLRPEMPESPTPGQFIVSADRDRLFIPVFPNAILLQDVMRHKWAARLEYPSQFIGPTLSTSADNRWLAAVPFKSTGNPKSAFV